MPDLPDRDRVTAILTLAEAATSGPWIWTWLDGDARTETYAVRTDNEMGKVSEPVARTHRFRHGYDDALFIAAARSEAPWLARRLLEALGTIDRVNALFAGGPDTSCRTVWDGEIECVSVPIEDLRQALNGGNE